LPGAAAVGESSVSSTVEVDPASQETYMSGYCRSVRRATAAFCLSLGMLDGASAQQYGPSPLEPPSAFPAAAAAPRYDAPRYSVVPAQFDEPFAPPATPAVDELDAIDVALAPGGAAPTADEQLSQAELLDRLRKTEARIQQLEKQSAPLKDPQTTTMLRSMRERWDTAKDPSITTVDQQTHNSSSKKASEKKWYDRLSIRGYAQFRWNEVLDREPGSAPAQYVGDSSIGEDRNFIIRRARVIISGDVSDHLYVYLQPDFASTPNGNVDQFQFAQIRDWYGDVYLDNCKVHRFRIGQSKVPYGWENMQSSSNRLALDRADGLNSAVRNERDLGVFYYYTPEFAQDFFKDVLDMGLKGSGNYGMFGMGIYNGQGGSLAEQNDDIHFVSRFTLPVRFANGQMMETSIQGYVGDYAVIGQSISPLGVGGPFVPQGTIGGANVNRYIRDERVASTFVWYPQPLGFQAEWNVGRGPGLNDAQTAVIDRHLYGGYLQSMYKIDTRCNGTIFPFVRWSYFKGGYKPERNAPFSEINEVEMGTEWQFTPQCELTTSYLITDRTNTTANSTAGVRSYDQFEGSVLRFQFQINY
jgi:hypothetical protein